jgi:diaminohydroxyphosphoribosylaminopyrimidine deaminase/5-amino-6-(5-phosphoribosylamino)uracil reductase
VGASPDKRASLEEQGVWVEAVARDADGHVDLTQALQALGMRGITRVFSEGGPHVAAALIGQGLADEIILIRGEKPFGGVGLPALSEAARQHLDNPARFSSVSESRAGADRLIRYERVF